MSYHPGEDLRSRYRAACELKQRPDRDRIARTVCRWAMALGLGAPAIEFVCNAKQYAAIGLAPPATRELWDHLVELYGGWARNRGWSGWSHWSSDTGRRGERQPPPSHVEFWSDWAQATAGSVWHAGAVNDTLSGWDVSQLAVLAVSAAYTGETKRMLTWLNLLEAFEAGAYVMWLRMNTIYVAMVPDKILFDERNRLHCADGPAFKWFEGVHKYYWHGIRLSEYIIERSEEISVANIDAEPSLEIRRMMIERYRLGEEVHGRAAFTRDGGAKRLDHDERYGTLWRREMQRDEPLVLLEVINSTREPDGRFKHYWLRVPPDMNSAHQAAAWTFGQSPDKYSPLVEA